MHPDFQNADLHELLQSYNQEVKILKFKLLGGESWENLREHKRNVTELAIAIHKKRFPRTSGDPADFPYWDWNNDPKDFI